MAFTIVTLVWFFIHCYVMAHVYLSAMGVHDFMVLSSCVHVFLSVCVYYKGSQKVRLSEETYLHSTPLVCGSEANCIDLSTGL